MPNRFPSLVRRVLALAAVVVVASSCTGVERVTDYGPQAKQNFVNACEQDIGIDDGEIVRDKLAPRNTCVCVYTAIKDEFRLPWDDLAEYEQAVADADAGDPPAMPEQLRRAINKCTTAGPAAPSATTTTEEPEG